MKISLTIILSFLGMLSLHAQNISDAALFSQLKEGEKGAVVAVHIGTDDASVSAHTKIEHILPVTNSYMVKNHIEAVRDAANMTPFE